MNKKEIKVVVQELIEGIYYPETNIGPLYGCGLDDFPKNKMVRKEVIVMHLRWQCLFLNGNIDEEELTNCLFILKDKKVIMI